MTGKKILIFLLMTFYSLCVTLAQDKGLFIIKGKVVDSIDEPLPGVSVKAKNMSTKTVTADDGSFIIKVNKEPIELVFSYIGMREKTVLCKSQKAITVVLEDNAVNLDNVVITGYQEIDKRKLSSSITTMKMSELQTPSTNSLDQMLQGRIAGLAVMNLSSTVGVAPKIRIRGSSSITGNREPIWVVDGIILDEPVSVSVEELNNIDNVNFIGNAISGINPDDIERIDVLKDVSATAIYGVKAANGVIVVTTKRGKGQRPTISYKANWGVTMAPNYGILDLMNSKERIEVSEEMLNRGLEFKTYRPTDMGYEGELQKLWSKETDYDTFRKRVKDLKELNTDWMNLLFRNALSQQHSVSVSGGGKRVDYYVSLGYLHQEGVSTVEKLKQLTGKVKVNMQLTNHLEAGVDLSTNSSDANYAHHSIALLDYAYRTSRAIPAFHDDGTYFYYNNDVTKYASLPFNIFNELNTTGQDVAKKSTNIKINLTWRPWDWLKLQSLTGMSTSASNQENWADEQSFYVSKMRLVPYGGKIITGNEYYYEDAILPLGGELKYENSSSKRYTFRNVVDLNKTWKKHHLFASVGTELISIQLNSHRGRYLGYMPFRGKTFADIDVSIYKGYARAVQASPLQIIDNTLNTMSLFSTMTYTFDDRYIANFNIRTDGSNRFGQDKSVRFLPVWSTSGRWNVHREKMLQSWSWLDELALRASYGVQGNVHPSQTPYLIVKQENYNSILGEFVATLKQFPNKHLRWEKTVSYNFGIDFSIFHDRVSASLDVYNKKGYDQIIQRRIAPSNGADFVTINEGDIENKGWELAFNVVPLRTKDLVWSMSFNTGQNFNKVTQEGDTKATWQDYVNGTLIKNGYAVNSLYAYRFKGLNGQTGLPMFYGETEKDEHGKTIINSQQEAFDAAFVYVGKREPDLTGGFSSSFKYKSFTLNALFSFALGNKIRLNDLYTTSGQGLPYPQQNMSHEFVNRWRQPGDEYKTNIPALSDNQMRYVSYDRVYPIADNRWDMYNKSDIRVVSGSFLRCRSVSLRYELTKKLLDVLHLRGGYMSFETSNLFVLKDPLLRGRDPEQISLSSGAVPPRIGFACQISLTF